MLVCRLVSRSLGCLFSRCVFSGNRVLTLSLCTAIFAQDTASVRLLLQRGVPITGIASRDRFGAPPLVFAAQHGTCEG
jgi:hypothetical protein